MESFEQKVLEWLDAVTTRLDDAVIHRDQIEAKLDRYRPETALSAQAAEQALTAINALNRRVTRLGGK